MRYFHVVVVAGFLLMALPGCIVVEIRDSLKSANDQLVCVQFAMDEANKGLAQANTLLEKTNERLDAVESGLTRLDRTNTLIDNVEQGLGRIDNTNTNLSDLQKQLAMLESIEKSLMRLDQHLAGLRKSVGALDGVIPFLDLGGEYVEPTVAPPTEGEIAMASNNAPSGEAGAAAAEDAGQAAAPSGGDAAAAGADKAAAGQPAGKRDSLMGVWMSAYPDKSMVLVVHSNGRYERAMQKLASAGNATPAPAPAPATAAGQAQGTGGKAPSPVVKAEKAEQVVEFGSWKRTGDVVEFTADPPAAAAGVGSAAAPSGGEAAAGAQPSQPAPSNVQQPAAPPPSVWKVRIVSISPRALAVEVDRGLMLFGRP